MSSFNHMSSWLLPVLVTNGTNENQNAQALSDMEQFIARCTALIKQGKRAKLVDLLNESNDPVQRLFVLQAIATVEDTIIENRDDIWSLVTIPHEDKPYVAASAAQLLHDTDGLGNTEAQYLLELTTQTRDKYVALFIIHIVHQTTLVSETTALINTHLRTAVDDFTFDNSPLAHLRIEIICDAYRALGEDEMAYSFAAKYSLSS